MFMDINETIKTQLSENPIILYMKGSPQAPQCGFSAKTSQALMACGERFAFVNILDNQELREALKVYSNWPTYPQLYVNGELVGGCDIIMEMSENGELATLVKEAARQAEA
ncbi:glutaredoxin [Streptosporangium jomthongense]|nr:glutaredoxin [Streptosporangium jomthongense]